MSRRVTIQTPLGESLQFHQLVGREALSQLYTFDIDLLGSSNAIDSKALLGKASTVAVETESGGVRYLGGIATRFGLQQEDARHSFYRLQLRPWLWLATRRSDFRIFQGKSVPDILTEVLGSYGHPIEKKLSRGDYRRWDYCVQYHESDFNFISRLCELEGIYYYFRHEASQHVLVFADDIASSHAPLPGGESVRFHPLEKSGMGQRERIYAWETAEEVRAGHHYNNDYDFEKPKADLSHLRQMPPGHDHDSYENYEWPGGFVQHADGETYARIRNEEQLSQRSRASGRSNLRELATGHTLRLTGHPRSDQNRQYLLLSVSYHLQENLQASEGAEATEGSVQRFAFDAQPTSLAWRPRRTTPKPRTRGPQTAMVVGPAGEEIWTDQYGRIKVQFHWDRLGKDDENSSCWVRVSTAWAGATFGAVSVPRIGMEVIVDFLNGDPDYPIVTGCVYNADTMAAWQLPEQKHLSGIRSRELGGGRGNHLVLDDTHGKIQAQLRSDHQASQLSVGHIGRIEDTAGRKEPRGQGFELRTDGHGVVRSAKGLLVTTETRANAQAHMTDMGETVGRLTQGRDLHESLGEIARTAKAHEAGDQDEVARSLKEQTDAIKGQGGNREQGEFAEFQEPHLTLASPAGIQTTAQGSTHIVSVEHTAITSGAHASFAAGNSFLVSAKDAVRIAAFNKGIRMVAAAADIDITALKDSINALAKLDIKMEANRITITAKEEIVVNGGSSYTRWNAGGIESGTNGLWRAHASSHSMVGPKSDGPPRLPQPPQLPRGQLDLYHRYVKADGAMRQGVKQGDYTVVDSEGATHTGKLDSNGFASVAGLPLGQAKVTFGGDPSDPWETGSYFGKPDRWPAEPASDKTLDSEGGGTSFLGGLGGAGGLGSVGSLGSSLGGMGGLGSAATGLLGASAAGSLGKASGLVSQVAQAANTAQQAVGAVQSLQQGGAKALLGQVGRTATGMATQAVGAKLPASLPSLPSVQTPGLGGGGPPPPPPATTRDRGRDSRMAEQAPQNKAQGAQPTERERQTAVAPLNTIGVEDIGAGAAKIDKWLRKLTNDYVTLNVLKTFAGSLPVIGNIMALIDAVWDIVEMITKKAYSDVLQWVSLAINLLGVIPFPPGTGAARMSLRPMLHLLKQEIAKSAKNVVPNIGEAFVTVLITHLNDTIAGTLDKFVDEALGYLDDFLQSCAKKVDGIADALIGALQVALGEKPVFATGGTAEKNTYDPKTQSTWGRMMAAAAEAAKKSANYAAAKASHYGLPDAVKAQIRATVASLTDLKGAARRQIMRLGDESLQYGIKWMIKILKDALLRRKGKHAASINATKGSEVRGNKPGGEQGATSAQVPASGDPGCKNCAVSGAGGAIALATGCESFDHTDFVLGATLPISWTRVYRSNLGAFDQGSLGARWITPYTTRVDVAKTAKGRRQGEMSLIYHGADGRSHAFPLLDVGKSHHNPIEEITLTRLSERLLAVDFGKPVPAGEAADWRETYELVDTVPAKAASQGNQHFRLVAQHARGGAAVGLRYDHVIAATGEEVLSDIISRQGDAVIAHVGTRPDARTGLIKSLWELKDGQVVRQLAAYTHDADGDLVTAQDENGAGWQYSYSHHLVTRYTDRTGRGMNLQYDGTVVDAKAVREWADDGSFALTLEWDRNIRLTYLTDAIGGETWYYYDVLGYTYRIIHPDKREEWFLRDDAKNITRHIHTDGSTDDYVYDANGNLKTHTRADGSRVHYEYDARHRVTGILDAEGGVWKREHDASGNLTEEIDPLGNKTEYAYDEAGQPVCITDAKGGVKTLAYTPAGQLASYTDCSGKVSSWEYDSRGRLVEATDAAGQSTRYRYTPVGAAVAQGEDGGNRNHPGRLEEIVLPDGTREHFAHDAEGRLLAHTDALGRRTRYSYTRAGLVAGRVDAAGHTLRYQWDLLGRLTELHNENGSRYDFRYDPVGKLLEEVGFDRKATRYRYEESTGVLAEVVDAGHSTTLAFDPLGRLTERQAAEQTERFAYDGNGRLVEAANGDARLQWFYDPAGNLAREHHHYIESGRTAVWRHGYDELNQRVTTIRPDGHTTQWLTYGSGHVHGLLVDGQDILDFERDDLHREITREQGNGLTQKLRYDPAGRLLEQQISQTRPGAIEAAAAIRRSYAYDKAGQLVAIGDSRRGSLSYRYDPVGRLLEANSRLGRETFAFDPAGNIGNPSDTTAAGTQAAGRVTNRVAVRLDGDGRSMAGKLMDNLLKDYAGTHYKWDERGNLVERTSNGEKTVFTWDGFNRMRSATTYGKTTTFSYDALGRRIAKRSEHDATLFGWDGDTLAFESTQSTEGEQEQQQAWRGDSVHYIHEPGSFVPLVQIRQAQAIALSQTTDVKALIAANGGRYDIEQDPLWNGQQLKTPQAFAKEEIAFYQCDHLGTPQELTDHEGRIAWSASYKAWGEARQAISEAGRKAGFRNPIRFQGQYFDDETGLHYNRYRYYDPVAGRFVSGDPIGLAGGTNLHLFVPNPVQWVDPLGLTCHPTRRASLRDIRRQLGIPMSQQPIGQKMIPLTDSTGGWILGEDKKPIMTRELTYRVNGKNVVVQDHSAGHYYGEGGVGDQPSHHNVRPEENTRTGKVDGMDDHYYFNCRNKK